MTAHMPAARAGFALPSYEHPAGTHPPQHAGTPIGERIIVVTRIYFPDEADANAADPVLVSLTDPGRAATLIAAADPQVPGRLRFDINLQGDTETVFFDV